MLSRQSIRGTRFKICSQLAQVRRVELNEKGYISSSPRGRDSRQDGVSRGALLEGQHGTGAGRVVAQKTSMGPETENAEKGAKRDLTGDVNHSF